MNGSATVNGHANGAKDVGSTKDENDDSEDDKEEDGGGVETGAPGGRRAKANCSKVGLKVMQRPRKRKRGSQRRRRAGQVVARHKPRLHGYLYRISFQTANIPRARYANTGMKIAFAPPVKKNVT